MGCGALYEESCVNLAVLPLLYVRVLAWTGHCSEAHHFGNVTLVFAIAVGRSLLSCNYDVPLQDLRNVPPFFIDINSVQHAFETAIVIDKRSTI